MEKICFKCLELKPLSEYYVHAQMGDGHLNKCKECTKKDSKTNSERLSKNPEWVEKELDRQRIKQRKKNGFLEIDKEAKSEYIKKYRETYPEKYVAQNKVNNTIRNGTLKKEPCIICGSTKSQAHHEDYSKPLDVIWYCSKHHADRHVEIRREERKKSK